MSDLADKFEFRVRWQPFLLRPNTPLEGTPKPAAFSDPTNPRVVYLKQAGADVGIEFSHKAAITPNTLKAHALLELAEDKAGEAAQNAAAERLFKAYFTDGQLLDDPVILEVAKQIGLDVGEVKTYVNDSSVIQAVQSKAQTWSERGVSGVPFFYMNGHRMFSGAQDVETFKKMMEMAAEKFPLPPASRS